MAVALAAVIIFSSIGSSDARHYWHHSRTAHHYHFRHRIIALHHNRRRWAARRIPIPVSTGLPVIAADLVHEAEAFNGRGNFTGFRGPWCKAGLDVWLRRLGYFANASLRAIDALRLGPRLAGPAIGAIFVKPHHTGIVIGRTARGILTISANHGHRVGIGIEHGILAYVEPTRGRR